MGDAGNGNTQQSDKGETHKREGARSDKLTRHVRKRQGWAAQSLRRGREQREEREEKSRGKKPSRLEMKKQIKERKPPHRNHDGGVFFGSWLFFHSFVMLLWNPAKTLCCDCLRPGEMSLCCAQGVNTHGLLQNMLKYIPVIYGPSFMYI